jgi:hypothetical protein
VPDICSIPYNESLHERGAHEIGFLLLYFQPALYCNVSDAWLFPEKSKRLWVMFAGAYSEAFIWSLAHVDVADRRAGYPRRTWPM